jgi:hypothetical protein
VVAASAWQRGALRRGLFTIALASLSLSSLFLSACATLAGGGGGDKDLPNAGAGPFRELREGELGNARSPPNALFDDDTFPRDPSVIDVDGDAATFEVAGYFAAGVEGDPPSSPPRAIVRYGALDARSFDRSADIVLEPAEAWEGDSIGAPSALRVAEGSEVVFYLYYAAAGGIGLARSADGLVFTREPAPVLSPDSSGWENGATPRSPGVVRLADGSFRMFYEILGEGGASIGEARSDDGLTFTRIVRAPALSPAGEGSADEAYDAVSVGSPSPVLAATSAGAPILRLYYRAVDQSGRITIGLAARFGNDAPLERAASPVFGAGSSLDPGEPSVLAFEGFSLLFATQRTDTGEEELAVAAGVAPATAALPPVNPP